MLIFWIHVISMENSKEPEVHFLKFSCTPIIMSLIFKNLLVMEKELKLNTYKLKQDMPDCFYRYAKWIRFFYLIHFFGLWQTNCYKILVTMNSIGLSFEQRMISRNAWELHCNLAIIKTRSCKQLVFQLCTQKL